MNNSSKLCTSCGESKPATTEYFSRDSRAKDGFRCYCKLCVKARYGGRYKEYARQYRETHREQIAQEKKRDYENNREHYLEYKKHWWQNRNDQQREERRRQRRQRYNSNPAYRDELLRKQREYRKDNPDVQRDYYIRNAETIRARVLKWQQENRDRRRQRNRAWYQKNIVVRRAKTIENTRKYRQRLKEAPGDIREIDKDEIAIRQDGLCFYCGKSLEKPYHRDHVIPLSRGGTNHRDNIVVACPDCNLSKGANTPYEWKHGGDSNCT